MKIFKTLLTVILAFTMCMTCAAGVFADTETAAASENADPLAIEDQTFDDVPSMAEYDLSQEDIENVEEPEQVAEADTDMEGSEETGYKAGSVPQIYVTTESGEGNSLVKETGYVSATIAIVDTDGSVLESAGQIKVRGNSSSRGAKKPFNIKFEKKQDVLNMGKAKKWALLANCFDPTLMRTYVGIEIARYMGMEYTSQQRVSELYLDGVFKGCYILTENVEAGSTRVDIDTDNGDFLLEYDRSRVEDGVTYVETPSGIRFAASDPDEPTEEQTAHMTEALADFDEAVLSEDYEKVCDIVDVDSFAKFYILNEYIKNVDVNFSSVYFYYKDGKFYAGPAWDYDLSGGNYNVNKLPELADPDGGRAYLNKMFNALMYYKDFKSLIQKYFNEYESYFESVYSDGGLIDSFVSTYRDVIDRNYNEAGWDVSEQYMDNTAIPEKTYDENVEYYKNFLEEHLKWFKAEVADIQNGLMDMKWLDGKYYYFKDGVIDTSYEGIAENAAGYFTVKNGTFNNKVTGLVWGTIDGNNGWYYFVNGKFTQTTGIVQKADGSSKQWYYVENGVYKKSTGIARKADGSSKCWYYVENGVYKKSTGIARKADESSPCWYYVENGVYKKSTGIARKADGSSSCWYYVENGVYKKSTGIARKADGSSSYWYYVENGVYTKATGIAQRADAGSARWYYVSSGRYIKSTGFAQRADGSSKIWFYVNNGVYSKSIGIGGKLYGTDKNRYLAENGIISSRSCCVVIGGVSYTVINGVVR